MNRVFSIIGGIKVPDGTIVYPFLNSKDATSDLPWDLVEGFSIAAGDIEPNSASKIQNLGRELACEGFSADDVC